MANFTNLPEHLIDRANVLDLERLRAYKFVVQIGAGIIGSQLLGGFSDVEGLGDTVRTRDVKEGGAPALHRFPRANNTQAITLRRGMSTSHKLWQWYQEVVNWQPGVEDYRLPTLSIFMLDQIFIRKLHVDIPYEVWRFDLQMAWPSAWQSTPLRSDISEHAFESLTIQHSGISVADGLFSGQAGDILGLLHQ